MLTELHIHNLITIQDLHIELQTGTTVITGETGAGKSVLMEAILLALGNRATGDIIFPGKEKMEITLRFDLATLPEARQWLKQYDLTDNLHECLIRRTLYKDGRSRSYINSMPTTLQPLKELGELLIQFHGQHEHQTLLKADMQRKMLDRYANHQHLIDKVYTIAEQWHDLQKEKKQCQALIKERDARHDLLSFQLQELTNLAPSPDEFQALDLEHKQLAHGEEPLENIQQSIYFLNDNEETSVHRLLNKILHALETVQRVDPKIDQWVNSIKEAIITLSDVEDELRHYHDAIPIDPLRLAFVEKRISNMFDLARKYRVNPNELYDLQKTISSEVDNLASTDKRLNELEKLLSTLEKHYFIEAACLTASRQQAAIQFSDAIMTIIHELNLPQAEFAVLFTAETRINLHGLEKITFQIKTNAGQTLQPLAKIASGGELSRIGLAIRLVTTDKQPSAPTLIFDEVDVGIGGGTAEMVGKHLRRLGNTHQVLCITHQPQVAAQGHHHVKVAKKRHEAETTITSIEHLPLVEKIRELARMLGGIAITETTLAHAREMLENVS